MESIINAMNTLIDNLAAIKAVIDSQEEEAGDELASLQEQMNVSFELAEAIRSALKRATATREEAAELISETVRTTLRPASNPGL